MVAADLAKAIDGRLLLVSVGQGGLSQEQLRTPPAIAVIIRL